MDHTIFYQLSLVLALATGIALVGRLLRQPPIIGYIVAGVLVGPSLFSLVDNREAFASFSQIGIALLLFIVGLGLNVAVIKSIGKPVLLTFLIIVLGLGPIGFAVAALLGFPPTECLLMAIGILCSSTIIAIKALSDKKGQSRLYGQLAIGILLVDDIVATLALVFVSAAAGGSTTAVDLAFLLAKGLALATGLIIAGAYILPSVVKFFAASQELLYLFGVAWALGVASIFWWADFSLEVGALFAGVALAHLPYARELSTRLKPLRDFFIILFFIGLGVGLGVGDLREAIVPALVFSLVIIMVKPILTMAGLGVLGYTKQTSFKTAMHLTQTSEFAIVLIVLAVSTGVADQRLSSIITLTAFITIATSAYLMKYDDALYRRLAGVLSVFERAEVKREVQALEHYPLVLLGYHKGGHEFIRSFRKMKKPYVVLDYDPEVIEELESQHIHHIYGDVTDLELLDEIGLHKSELIISTIADAATNQIILSHIMHHNKGAIFICHASSYDEAEALYEKGASYVILPHFIGSEQINTFIRKNGSNKQAFEQYRKRHLTSIGEVMDPA